MDPGAIIALVEICYTYVEHAESEVEKRVIIVESCWDRTKQQVDLVCCVMGELLNQLVLSLSLTLNTLEHVLHFGFRSKTAWAWKKEALDSDAKAKAMESKSRGPATAAQNPLALAAGLKNILLPLVEQIRSLFLPELQMEWVDIPFANARAGRRQGGDSRWYIIDTIELGQATSVRDIARDVRILTAKLSQADPLAFGLLRVVPVSRLPVSSLPPVSLSGKTPAPPSTPLHPYSPSSTQKNYSYFQIIFRIPEGMEVLQSLRQLLLNSDVNILLSCKLNITRELGKAINYVHTLAFVHKNIHPESVLCFEDPQSTNAHAFLIGFDAFRAADAGTMMGTDPSEKYNMQHDIYSLGTFVEYANEPGSGPGTAPQPKFSKTYHDFMALAPRMGDKYARVIISCLTCLDEDNEDFGGLEPENDDSIGLLFIKNIMKTLDMISV
ncbi:hypothetical protein BDV12DRAFT_208691 [Aspergillus spectabilis]